MQQQQQTYIHTGLTSWLTKYKIIGHTGLRRCEKDIVRSVDEFIKSPRVKCVLDEVPLAGKRHRLPRDSITPLESRSLAAEVREMLVEVELLTGSTESGDIKRRIDKLEHRIAHLPSLARDPSHQSLIKPTQMVLLALHVVNKYDEGNKARRPCAQLLHGLVNQVCRPTDTQLIEHSFQTVLTDWHSSPVQRMVACNRLAVLYGTNPLALDQRQAVRMLDMADEYMPAMELTQSSREIVLHGRERNTSRSTENASTI